MLNPLNPTLYTKLEKCFGEGNIVIVNEGQELVWGPSHGKALQKASEDRRELLYPGEEYKVSCPFCKESRKRLRINYRWGVYDPFSKTYNLWLAQCFNEQCLVSYSAQKDLYDMVFAYPRQRPRIRVLQGAAVDLSAIKTVDWPGSVVPLDRLARSNPDHYAVAYVRERGFDPRRVGRTFKVAYCEESQRRLADSRLIIPIYRNGIMASWQARYIGDPNFKKLKIPKYWSCPGTKLGRLAYNFDEAITHPTVVIVEGPMDVWGFGPEAFGLFGKTLSITLRRELVAACKKTGASVVVLLDPEQDEKEKAKGKTHHIEVMRQRLDAPLAGKVLPVYLPFGSDPGSMSRKAMLRLIRQEARKAGVGVKFNDSLTSMRVTQCQQA